MRLALAALVLNLAGCDTNPDGRIGFPPCPDVVDDGWCQAVGQPNDYCGLADGTLLVTHCNTPAGDAGPGDGDGDGGAAGDGAAADH